jgi:hypothetical protein
MAGSVHTRALQRAAEILGGEEKLRERLGVSARSLKEWMAGQGMPPTDVFLKAVDVICADISSPAGRARTREVSRKLRLESQTWRSAAALAIDRAVRVRRAIEEPRAPKPARAEKPRSALDFLHARFEPHDGGEMVEAALDAALAATGADKGNLQLRDREGLRIVAQRGFEPPFLDFFCVVSDHSSACGAAMVHARRIVVSDVAADPLFAATPAGEVLAAAGVRAVQSTPLIADGVLLGVLSTHYSSRRNITEHEQDLLEHIARRTSFWLDGGRL